MSGNSWAARVAGRLPSNDQAKKALTVLTVGLVSGVSVVIGEIALATLVFTGQLAPYLSQGIGLVLFGIFAACLVIALTSGFPGAVSAPAVPTMIMLAVIGASLTATGEELFPTMVAVIVIGSMATAACALLIARFRLANLMRFIPYPVSAGFVAGTGGIACVVALSLMGIRLDARTLASFTDPLAIANWSIGVAYGFGLYFATRRWNGFLLMPVSFVGLVVLCHLGLTVFGISTDRAEAAGLLFAGMSEADLWPPVGLNDAARIDWAAVVAQIPNILTLVLVTLLCVVMYVGGLELASNRELEWNREFGAVGLGAVAAGLGGGPPGCMIVPTSLRSLMFGVGMRSTGVVAALVMGAPLLFGDAVLKLVPVPLMGGVLLFTGIAMLDQWLLKLRKRMPGADYGIVLVIFVTILAAGFFEGVALGIVITIVFFIVRLSRIDVVDSSFTAAEEHSQRTRPIPDRAILRAQGSRVQGYRLCGYVFLGVGYPLADRLKASLGDEPRPMCILLDFKAVSGIDISSVNALCRFILAARPAGTQVVMSGAPDTLAGELQRNLPPPVYANLVFAPDFDRALEHCEDKLLSAYPSPGDADESEPTLLEVVGDDMERHLDRQALFEGMIDDLRDWLETREYAADEAIRTVGETSAVLQLVTSGQATVRDPAGTRLGQLGPGDAIDSRAPFSPSTANTAVVADGPCSTVTMTASTLRLLEDSDLPSALRLYRYLLSAEQPAAAGPN